MRKLFSVQAARYFYFSLLALLLLPSLAIGQPLRRHVRHDGDDNHDGLTWENALRNVQHALDISSPGDEVWVAGGRYEATQRLEQEGETLWAYSFLLRDGVHLYGGFAGHEQTIAERALAGDAIEPSGSWSFASETILTLPAGAEGAVITSAEKHFQLKTIIDGFTITGGRAFGRGDAGLGGGALLPAKAVLRHCQIVANLARSGGGLALRGGARAHACLIADNDLLAEGWNGQGGGIYLLGDDAQVDNSLIITNGAGGEIRDGGGISAEGAGLIVNCTIVDNTALRQGSGVSLAGSGGQLLNSLVWGNHGSTLQVAGFGALISHCGIMAGPGDNGNIPLESANCGLNGIHHNDNWVNGYYVCFLDVNNRNFRLGTGSYMINRGLTAPQQGDIDATGAERCQQGITDPGAYESPWLGNLALDFTVEFPCLYKYHSLVKPVHGLALPPEVNVNFKHVSGSIVWQHDQLNDDWSALWLAAGQAFPCLEAKVTGLQENFWQPFVLTRGLQVKPRPLIVAADDQQYTWGEPFPDFSWQIVAGSLAAGDTIVGQLASDYAGILDQTYVINQGTLQVEDGADGNNYRLEFWPGTLTCHKAAATLQADSDHFIYDAFPVPFTWQSDPPGLAGKLICQGTSGTVYGPSEELPVDAGTYSIHIIIEDPHYHGEIVVQVTIDKAPLTITVADAQRQYGIANPDFILQYDGLRGSDTPADITPPQATTTATIASPIGTYPIAPQGGQARNYQLLPKNGTLTITPANVSVDLTVAPATYGETLDEFNIAWQATHALNGTPVNGVFQWLPDGDVVLPAGEHLRPWAFWPNDNNYAPTTGEALVKVNKATLLVNAPQLEILAGEKLPDMFLTYHGFIPGESELTPGVFNKLPILASDLTTDSPPGHYQLRITPGEADNYAMIYEEGWLKINIAEPVLEQLAAIPIYYGATLEEATLTGGFSHPTTGAEIPGVLEWQNPGTLLPAGQHLCDWQFSPDQDEHYQIVTGQAEVTVMPRPLIIAAVDASKLYGDPDPIFAWVFAPGSMSLVGADQCHVVMTRDAGEQPGTYELWPSCPGLSSNYTATCQPGQFSITRLPLTVNLLPASKQYGEPDPTLNYQIVSGALLPGDYIAGGPERDAGEAPGTYVISQGTLSLPPYYDLTVVANGNFTIARRSVTITVSSWKKTYGDPDPSWQYKISGSQLLPGDQLLGSPIREPGENIGTYRVTAGDLRVNENYNLNVHCSSVTISPRPITVQADDQWRFPKMPNPEFSYRIIDGELVPGDSFSGALTASTTAALGTYAIKLGSLTLGENYTLQYQGGLLTVIAATIVNWHAEAEDINYGQPLSEAKINSVFYHPVTGEPIPGVIEWLQPNDIIYPGVLFRAARFIPDPSTWLDSLTVQIQVTVHRLRLKIVGTSYEVIWGDPFTDENGFQYEIVEGALLPGDQITGKPVCNTTGDVGIHAIMLAYLNFPTYYDVELIPGTLTIYHRYITVQAHNLDKLQRYSDPIFTFDIISGSLAGNAAFRGLISREFGETPGVYAMNQGTLMLNTTNCVLHFIPGTLTIRPHSLPYVVQASNINFGEPLSCSTLVKESGFDHLADGVLTWLHPETIVPIGRWPHEWQYAVDGEVMVQGWCNVVVSPTRAAVMNKPPETMTRSGLEPVDHNTEGLFLGWGVDIFSSLEEALEAVATGGEIFLYPGKYFSPEQGWLIDRDLTIFGMTDDFSEPVSLHGHIAIAGEQVFDVAIKSISLQSPSLEAGIKIDAPNADVYIVDSHLQSESTMVQIDDCQQLLLRNNTCVAKESWLTTPEDWQWPVDWLQENDFWRE